MNAPAAVLYAPNFKPPVFARSGASSSVAGRAIAVLSFAYCAAGTMGVVTPESIQQRSATSNSPLHYQTARVNPALGVEPVVLEPSPADDLVRVREVLKPAVLELANLFGVSRQAVYAWQNGAQPAPVAAARLAMLARAADVFAKAGVSVDTKTLRRKVAGGGTVLDAVLNGGDAVLVAQALVKTLEREKTQRQKLNTQLAGRQRRASDADEYGSPASADDA